MIFKICTNCGRFHLEDGKRLYIEGVAQPLKCNCAFPNVVSVQKWLEKSKLFSFFLGCLKDFIKSHKLYEFAFKSANEPYCEQYSERIKNAIVDTTYGFDITEFAEMLENDKQLLKEFFDSLSKNLYKNRHKERE